VLEVHWLMLTTVMASLRPRQDLVLENLLLRHQLAVLNRPTPTRSRARLRTWDKLLGSGSPLYTGWREPLTFVTPDTVMRWHRQVRASFGVERLVREVAVLTSTLRCEISS
jgi:hypothetical protein